jgi:hypothetical protein
MAANRGSRALRLACAGWGAQKRVSEQTGIPQSTLSKIISGQQPGRRHAVSLQEELAIDLAWWDEPAESESPAGGAA